MVWQLDEELWFPNPNWGEDDGLVAIGGDLSVERLLLAYSNGFFPWYAFQMEREPHWYCPLDRYVIFPDEIHISHSMRQLLRQQKYEVTVNRDFDSVIHGCSTAQGRNEENGAWLGPDIIEAFTRLHRQGYAASVEVWERQRGGTTAGIGQRLVGGLYGVTLRNAFFGESMFSLVPNASKLALIHLAKAMESIDGRFIDCQFETPLFKSMGGRHITYEEYMKLLKKKKKMNRLMIICLMATVCVLGLSAQETCGGACCAGKSVYDFKVKDDAGKDVSMADYKGKVLLIVNTATRCGFTPQYKELEALYEKYQKEGLEILDFPCNQFGEQAPGTIEEIHQFCTANFDIQFPQFDKVDVNGADESPLFAYLKAQKGFSGFDLTDQTGKFMDEMLRKRDADYDKKPDIKWNFTKFLVSRDGRVVKRYEPTDKLADIEADICTELK